MSIDGGTKSTRKLDYIQLSQKNIHLKAELSRYKHIVAQYQNNYHYSQLDELNSEIENLKGIVYQKEEELALLKKANIEIEEKLSILTEEQSQFGAIKSELIEKLNLVETENNRLKEENELVVLENSSLHKTLEHQEGEVGKLREALELAERDKSLFKPKKSTTTQSSKEADPSESWFLRTIKQNKDDEY
jgi:chromosome segregation ATPase